MKLLSDLAKFIYDELKQHPNSFYMEDEYYLKHKNYKNINLWVCNGFIFLSCYYNNKVTKIEFNLIERIVLWVTAKKALKIANRKLELSILDELKKT